MGWARSGVALIAVAVLAAQPCSAVARDDHSGPQRSGAFVGIKLNMPLGRHEREKPTARLQITAVHEARDTRTGEVRSISPSGLELGLSGAGKPKFTIGGREAPKFDDKMGIGGTGTTLLVVGGVVLVLLVVAVASTPPNVDFDD